MFTIHYLQREVLRIDHTPGPNIANLLKFTIDFWNEISEQEMKTFNCFKLPRTASFNSQQCCQCSLMLKFISLIIPMHYYFRKKSVVTERGSKLESVHGTQRTDFLPIELQFCRFVIMESATKWRRKKNDRKILWHVLHIDRMWVEHQDAGMSVLSNRFQKSSPPRMEHPKEGQRIKPKHNRKETL